MRRALGAVLLLGALAGCSADPVPVAPDPPPPASVPAPPVATARDASGLRGCAAPTARLAPDLVAPDSAFPTGGGCTWTDPTGASVLRADVRDAGGLGALYRASAEFRVFRTGELGGAPTVVTTPEDDPTCSLHVGVSDDELLVVQVGPASGPVPDACGAATAAATRLLGAMPVRR